MTNTATTPQETRRTLSTPGPLRRLEDFLQTGTLDLPLSDSVCGGLAILVFVDTLGWFTFAITWGLDRLRKGKSFLPFEPFVGAKAVEDVLVLALNAMTSAVMSVCEAFWQAAARLTCFLVTQTILLLLFAPPITLVAVPAITWAARGVCIGAGMFGVNNPISRFLNYSPLPLFFHYLCIQFNWFPSLHSSLYVANTYIAVTALIGITPLRSLLSFLAAAEDILRAGGISSAVPVVQQVKVGKPDCSQSLKELKKQLENLTRLVEAKMQAEERKA